MTDIKPWDKFFFENDWTDFSWLHQAQKRCKENWYSYWSMARDMRIWVAKWDCYIAKWYNLNKNDINNLDWYIYHVGDYRNWKVWVVIFDEKKL